MQKMGHFMFHFCISYEMFTTLLEIKEQLYLSQNRKNAFDYKEVVFQFIQVEVHSYKV